METYLAFTMVQYIRQIEKFSIISKKERQQIHSDSNGSMMTMQNENSNKQNKITQTCSVNYGLIIILSEQRYNQQIQYPIRLMRYDNFNINITGIYYSYFTHLL